MIINIKHKKDLITLDLRLRQLRYLNNFENYGLIDFLNVPRTDCEAYEYLFNCDKQLFLKSLRSDLKEFMNKSITLKHCEVLL